MKKANLKTAANEYWENVSPDAEVGVPTKQMVIDAYLSGARCVTSYLMSILIWRDDFFKQEEE